MQETRIIDASQTYDQQGQGLPANLELLGGKFKIDRQIGAGGFGITYIAQDTFLERAVVIKECFPESICMRFGNRVTVNAPSHEAQYRKIVDMFMREARSLARLRHPNIVSVHQAFEENGTAYMVLDLFEGRDLLDAIEDDNDTLKPDQIRDILLKVLDAIDLVHSNDLLHRDISPDNILLDKWGTPALIDFGAAREDASQKTGAVSTMLVVKDGYSPHEFYVSGGIQGPCSDLYALAATMYHLISGKAPPVSQTRVAALADLNDDPYEPLSGNFPQYEPAFLEAIDKAMSVPPKDRIQSAKDWLALIAQESKKPKKVQFPENKHLTKTISELIEETNKHVTPVISAEPVVAPKTSAPQRSERYRPEWVEEFNRETVEVAERKRREAERAAAQEAARRAEEARLAKQARLAKHAALEAERQRKQKEDVRSSRILGWVKGAKPD
ncbi:serine/threonine protein kinase [Roseobacter sp. CCS2]|uniref:serine/threonine protein kinase n=1 Tax=Roseobacter sp. CCS2 TaxID=391593 RepID=UPI0000F3E3CA|nr:serine/threonine-protein kinase [Roseobacter sp. CCS2]EBA12760.1 serine/threonine protein kinase [Roseobacter sp. CCS2]